MMAKKKPKLFLIYVKCKRKTKEIIGLLLDKIGHPTNRDEDKAEIFNAFFASVSNISDGHRISKALG